MKNRGHRLVCACMTAFLLCCTAGNTAAEEAPEPAGCFLLPEDVQPPAEQIFRDDDTGIKAMNAFLSGTVGAYVTDLDRDGKQEMIDVFLLSNESSDMQQIRIGFYEMDPAGNTVLKQDFALRDFYAGRMFDYDLKLSYFETKAGNYLVSNEIMLAGSGISGTAHILSIGNDKKLYAVTSLFDPGYTSGIGLYQLHNTSADKISELSYSGGDILYEWNAGDSGEPDSGQYYQKLNQTLAPYGIQASVSPLSGSFLQDTPFTLQGEKAVIAEVKIHRNYKTKVIDASYCGTDPFGADETDDAPFDPEKFYHKILNELRPRYADSFCFLDLDGDGREELLIGGMGEIIAVYASRKNTGQPVQLFSQDPGFPYYHLFGDGTVSFDPSPNRHGGMYGKVLYQVADGQLVPVKGYLCNGDCYYTDNKELLVLPLCDNLSEWQVITRNAFDDADHELSVQPFQPVMTPFAEYDSRQAFNPAVFYRKILEEQRLAGMTGSNEYAAGYRFLDLDEDGREELLLCGNSANPVWAPIYALYTSKPDSDEPVHLDLRYNPYDGGYGGCCISYTDGIGSTVQYSSGADLLPISVQVLYRFSAGELIPICGYADKENSERVFYTEDAAMLDSIGQYDYTEWDVGTRSDSRYQEMKELIHEMHTNRTHDIKPYVFSFFSFDDEREYQRIHPETTIPVTGAYGYDALLRKIRGIAAAPHRIRYESQGTCCLSTDDFSHLWLEYQSQGKLNDPCFVLRDLNDDGTPELAVGNHADGGAFELFDLYTIYDGEIIHLASSGYRDRFSIGSGDEIMEAGSAGAASGLSAVYTLKNGRLEPKTVLRTEQGVYYYLNNGGTPAESWAYMTQSEYIEKERAEFPHSLSPETVSLLSWNIGTAFPGDFNSDAQITVADAVLLARFAGEDQVLTDGQLDGILNAQPDQDHDGAVTVLDVVCYLHSILYRE